MTLGSGPMHLSRDLPSTVFPRQRILAYLSGRP
jgi:hypothetical protein